MHKCKMILSVDLFMDVGQTVQNLPEEPPEAADVQMQALVDGVS